MSNYYLCDTCAVSHWPYLNYGHLDCADRGIINGCVVISDSQTPHEVCPYWKPKEAE